MRKINRNFKRDFIFTLAISIGVSYATAVGAGQVHTVRPLAGCLDCFNFVAPTIVGAESLTSPEIGLIVYDSNSEIFRGYTDGGGWTNLSDQRVTQVITSATTLPTITDVAFVSTASAAFTITLPAAASVPGKIFTIKKTSSDFNLLTIDGNGAETIDGSGSVALVGFNGVVEVISDGTNFQIKSINDPWMVDATIAGANPSLGTSDQASYIGVESSALTLTNNAGALTAQIPCSSTNSPSGTTCASGSESIGVSFTAPRAGKVRACASFSHRVVTSTSGKVQATFQIVETPSNAQTVSQQGNSRMNNSIEMASFTVNVPLQVCGSFVVTAGQKTFRLMYEQDVTATVTTNEIMTDENATQGQRNIHWEVYPIE